MQSLFNMLSIWRQRMIMRRSLGLIDARSLRDAGIDPGLADYEAAQPFWRRPISLRDPAPARGAGEVANDHAPVLASRPLRAIAAVRR